MAHPHGIFGTKQIKYRTNIREYKQVWNCCKMKKISKKFIAQYTKFTEIRRPPFGGHWLLLLKVNVAIGARARIRSVSSKWAWMNAYLVVIYYYGNRVLCSHCLKYIHKRLICCAVEFQKQSMVSFADRQWLLYSIKPILLVFPPNT